MAALIARVTIMLKGASGNLRSVNGSAAVDYWRNAVVVEPGETFTENDPAEIARLVSIGAARPK